MAGPRRRIAMRLYKGTIIQIMPKEKVTLTLDADVMDELRGLVGRRSVSSSVSEAVAEHVRRLRHLRALGEWLEEMDVEFGPVPADVMAWAESVTAGWVGSLRRRRV